MGGRNNEAWHPTSFRPRHALSRRDDLEAIFRDGKEPELFVAALVQACAKTNWQIHPFAACRDLTSGRQYAKMWN